MSEKKTEVTLIKSQGKVEGVRAERNDIEGYGKVAFIDAEGDVIDTVISDNKIVSPEVKKLLQELQKAADNLEIAESQRTDLNQHISTIKSTVGSPDFTETYKEFTNFLSAHMTIMTPLLPFMAQLGTHLC
ncbi:TPA: hypothetical protein ACX6R1_001358 [Photobacterium damselae]|uniref:hypothetical protein n=1 Tax=Photobacterium damselae TaxID=38293 RepID=UPI0040687DF4